jgi:serine/threonine protein kinase
MNDPRSPLESGMTLRGGDFSIESPPLGMGGFGITYRAHDHRLQRVVAVKEFFPQGCIRQSGRVEPSSGWTIDGLRAQRDRFLEEGRTLARLRHAGIPVIFDIFEENQTAYLVMEFVEGQTFAQYLADKKLWFLPPDEAVSLIRGAGEALSLMHGAQLLHRDLKPANIMRRFDGQVMLIDFGASRDFLPEAMHTLTVIFTAGYAPLEQYTRSGNHGPYTDVYSLAATLYHLLTGQKPLEAPRRATGEVLATPNQVNPVISPALSDAVMHGLQISPSQRPATVEAFLRELTASQAIGFDDSYSGTVAVTSDSSAASSYSTPQVGSGASVVSPPVSSPRAPSSNAPSPSKNPSSTGNGANGNSPNGNSSHGPSSAVPAFAMPPAHQSAMKVFNLQQTKPGKIKRWWNSMLATLGGGLKVVGWTSLGWGMGFAIGSILATQLPFSHYSARRMDAVTFMQFDVALMMAMWLGRRSYLNEKRLRLERIGKVKVFDPSKFSHVILSTVWGAVASSILLAVLGTQFLALTNNSNLQEPMLMALVIWPILWVSFFTDRFYKKTDRSVVKPSID